MDILYTVFGILLLLFLLFLFLICPRLHHPEGSQNLARVKYAHRGLHSKKDPPQQSIPENSLAAFRAATEKGYGMELDINLSKDGRLIVMHDNNIKRICGSSLKISEATLEQLRPYRLSGTDEPIPTLEEALIAADGAPLLIELKTVGNNWKQLCEKTFEVLDAYEGPYCMESFDPRVLSWLRHNRPQVFRGQLAMNFIKHKSGKGRFYDFAVTLLLCNVIGRPDFIAYSYKERNGIDLPRRLACAMGAYPFFWTIRKKEEGERILQEGASIIFESYEA